jgi:hypothetical protein
VVAPEGALAAAALRCIGGQKQCRLVLDIDEKRERAARMRIIDSQKIFLIEDMVREIGYLRRLASPTVHWCRVSSFVSISSRPKSL